MTFYNKSLLLVAGLALAACTNPSQFGSENRVDLNASGSSASASFDPATPAYFTEIIGDRVLFEVDQSTLNADARNVLAGQAQWLLNNGGFTVQIEGHADEQGTREYNLALGARRASAVQQYLISQGVAANRLRTVTYGKERPLEICSDETCYAKNRRAVTVLASGLTS
ncbi:18K peptidoglycan-associated outer membrane lipoprotein [Candidatus Rhodobacter oscarellae]|uniref:Peptidoglycan-associated lipoprotein n=1 Tax=Candidatus Rhodobacter oscarellae TaxID=1675527 RepID=A0A0J9ECN1_9RHOB|nr:peptidoglycan-associated lipoprotein Pal [Candidatus Rhodobacter lobularis]KMW59479.1 18K peptidoglycan-associated outer membrane lipoprotein [Candidatus Rhodobacter lobularis]